MPWCFRYYLLVYLHNDTDLSFCIADLDNQKKDFKLSEWLFKTKIYLR